MPSTYKRSTASTGMTWRLSWRVAAGRSPVLRGDSDDTVGRWVASTDPASIRAFAVAQDWPLDMTLRVSVSAHRTAPPIRTVRCRPAAVAAWDTSRTQLPKNDEAALPAERPSSARLAFLRAMRAAVDDAVAARVLPADDAVGLMLLASDALERRQRERERYKDT